MDCRVARGQMTHKWRMINGVDITAVALLFIYWTGWCVNNAQPDAGTFEEKLESIARIAAGMII